MPDIQINDTVKLVPVKVDLAHPSSLVEYLRTEALHLAVVPDFLAHENDKLPDAAASEPLVFKAHAEHKFQLIQDNSEIDVKPEFEATITFNAKPDTNLFDDDPFRLPAKIPAGTSYVSVAFEGSLDVAASIPSGDLTFGFEGSQTIDLEYSKAFPLAGGPTLLEGLVQTLESYIFPASLEDLERPHFGINDIAAASGQGSLKISGGVAVTASPNPLASVALPLGLGPIAVKPGATAGLSASFTISGAYQVRARRIDADTIELSFLQERGTALKTDLTASAGVVVNRGTSDTDLINSLVGAVSKDPSKDQESLKDLNDGEAKTLAKGIKDGIDHSLQVSLDAALARLTDDQAAFQYQIQPALLSPENRAAVNAALKGDLRSLTELEESAEGDMLAPGIRVMSSVFSTALTHEASLKLNLLGIFNYITISDLIRASEIVHDPVSGDVTIKDKTTGTEISAITEPILRTEQLRKVLFDSVVLTTTYVASRAVQMPGFRCTHAHFALQQNASEQVIDEYLNWFVALNLIAASEQPGMLAAIPKGDASSCILRTGFGDSQCRSLFFDGNNQLWAEDHYLDLGRLAMRALLQPQYRPVDRYRFRLLVDDLWPEANRTGPVEALADLVGVERNNLPVVGPLMADVYAIRQWAKRMVDTGKLVLEMDKFVKNADPVTLTDKNKDFTSRRKKLQDQIAEMLGDSRMHFDEPWGMVAMFWSAGSPQPAYGKIARKETVDLERGKPPAAELAAAG